MIVSGVDVWLNTPERPNEASGTSGMKAAHNAVPSLSVLDGWWLEGNIEGVTGWSIGPKEADVSSDTESDARELYEKLEKIIVPIFYNDRDRWIEIMKHSIAVNASFFNTHRMVQQYVLNSYLY
jgi:starch phosphorylase